MSLQDFYTKLPRQTSPKSDFVREIMVQCNVSFTTAMNWINGKNKPRLDEHLQILSNLTGIEKSNLFL